ncbi:MAG: hypothetical protein HFJ94_01035 [Muribaculaceae bacterium]|nr:hypothetical protein [Muribaculaceae bacterium]
MFRILFITTLLLAITGCSASHGNASDESGAPFAYIELDESKSTGVKDIKLSDLIDNYTVVNFENSDSAIFKPHKAVVSDNYIAVI